MIFAVLPQRVADDAGDGAFGASRGDRKHNGIDYSCATGTGILAPCDGQVTKLGYPYADALEYRYVQITDANGLNHRVFYISPTVELNQWMVEGTSQIGTAQDIAAKYPARGMANHVHYEIKDGSDYIDPSTV